MLNTKLNLVVSYFDLSNRERVFLSKSIDYFIPLSVYMQPDEKIISQYLDDIIYSTTDIPETEHYLYNLLSLVKDGDTLNINYATLLPDTIKVKSDTYCIKNNIAMLDPLVRKAMIYV